MLNPSNKPIARFYNKGSVINPQPNLKLTPAPFSCKGEPPQGVFLHRTPILRVLTRVYFRFRR
uniref:Uncharacterized protein n=1 Tax=Siphoviridae sp. ctzXg6 TaxID=2826531 RepID=A0A8S5NDA2_9CAUD|nr:MAG TPA: hypothetical protein [Siphoviridae sp. ctzXg6]